MWGSVEAMAAWNKIAPSDQLMSLETAVFGIPNALAGAADHLVGSASPTCSSGGRGRTGDADVGAGRERDCDQPNRGRKTRCLLLSFWWPSGVTSERATRCSRAGESAALVHRSGRCVRSDAGVEIHAAIPPPSTRFFNAITDENPGRNKPVSPAVSTARWRLRSLRLVVRADAGHMAILRVVCARGGCHAARLLLRRSALRHERPGVPLGVPLATTSAYLHEGPLAVLAAPDSWRLFRSIRLGSTGNRGFILLRVLACSCSCPIPYERINSWSFILRVHL